MCKRRTLSHLLRECRVFETLMEQARKKLINIAKTWECVREMNRIKITAQPNLGQY